MRNLKNNKIISFIITDPSHKLILSVLVIDFIVLAQGSWLKAQGMKSGKSSGAKTY